MLFPARFHPGLADGSVTLTFRNWRRPQVKAGGEYNVGAVRLVVDAVSVVDVGTITEADAVRAGFQTVADVVDQLRRFAGGDRRIYRVEFHRAGDAVDRLAPLRNAAALSAGDVAAITTRLDRLDAKAATPWTRPTLALIAAHPARRAGELAEMLGRERLPFKADVRKLKALGLTESLEIGYRLSARGEAYLLTQSDPTGKRFAYRSTQK